MSDIEDAGEHTHDHNNNNNENMIRLKFSGEFHDRSQYSIDLCTDCKSIMTLLVYMAELKKGLAHDPMIVNTIDTGLSAITSVFQSIRAKVQPSVQLSGSIFGPFSPMGSPANFTPKDIGKEDKPGVNPKDMFPPYGAGTSGIPFSGISDNFKEIGDMLGKLSDITNKMFDSNTKDKGYKSYSPKEAFDPKKIFEKDNAEADTSEDTDKKKDDKGPNTN